MINQGKTTSIRAGSGPDLTMHKMKKILIVDDEPDICLTLANVLEGNGFVVDTFDDPLLALQDFRKVMYDLLILDIKMEKMNGFELYEEIRMIDDMFSNSQ